MGLFDMVVVVRILLSMDEVKAVLIFQDLPAFSLMCSIAMMLVECQLSCGCERNKLPTGERCGKSDAGRRLCKGNLSKLGYGSWMGSGRRGVDLHVSKGPARVCRHWALRVSC